MHAFVELHVQLLFVVLAEEAVVLQGVGQSPGSFPASSLLALHTCTECWPEQSDMRNEVARAHHLTHGPHANVHKRSQSHLVVTHIATWYASAALAWHFRN
jgi:hypothetical protein